MCNKKRLTAVLFGFAILFSYSLVSYTIKHMTSDGKSLVTFVIASNSKVGFSFDPKDSDDLANHALLDNLVGTLVKYGDSGRIEPFLADSWQVSENGKHWVFRLKAGLFCEDGTLISAPSYVENLTRQLKAYAKAGSVLDFEKLRGWKNFISGSAPKVAGLYNQGNYEIVFDFERKSEDFLELLRMVYFGFWCKANFEESGTKPRRKLISSGAFRVSSTDPSGDVVITKRTDWFSISSGSPDQILFKRESLEQALLESGKHRLIYGAVDSRPLPANYGAIQGPPTLLTTLVMSPYTAFFKKQHNRALFRSRLYEAIKANPPNKFGYTEAETFYPFSGKKIDLEPYDDQAAFDVTGGGPVKIIIASHTTAPVVEYTKNLIEKAFGSKGPAFSFVSIDKTNPKWLDEVLSNEVYDIRVGLVDVGGRMLNLINKMIFCSRLGVSYPDPSGRICDLVERQEQSDSAIDQEYIEDFNRILFEDAAVIPLYHAGNRLLHTRDFELETISPIPNDVRFDLLRLTQ